MPAKKPQDHKTPSTAVFDLDAETPEAKPFKFKAGGKVHELPGEIPFGFAMEAAALMEEGLNEQVAGARLLPAFIALCPPEVQEILKSSGGSKTERLFSQWAEAVNLGESSPS